MSKKITLRVKARHGEDPRRILDAINQTAKDNPDRDVTAHVDLTAAGDSTTSLAPTTIPDEPRETDLAAKGNKHLDDKRARMRGAGNNPDKGEVATPKERVAARVRLKQLRTWAADKFGNATIQVVVRAAWDAIKTIF